MVVETWRRIADVEDGVRMGVRTVALATHILTGQPKRCLLAPLGDIPRSAPADQHQQPVPVLTAPRKGQARRELVP